MSSNAWHGFPLDEVCWKQQSMDVVKQALQTQLS